ncbi:MAG: TetR family transcriptional regulator [Rhodobacteraceae bacterium]|nr:TetR family transcriptional regulator [Paracoccaceae bacterium]MBO27868.1 TetR family transcriptional regulator [Paracoccaceae bacterium]|tara:strand:- start:41 stop:679 length:639 start_codon:yes stop_codon:yes gene_type:complete
MARTAGSHSDITGPRVRDAALRLFARTGYAAVSMRAIAAEVGVQAGALYNYTADKQSLLYELMRDHMVELLDAAQDDEALPPEERLRRFVEFHIAFHSRRPEEVFIAYMELRNLTPENFQRIEALRQRYERRLERILRDGVESGDFSIGDTRIATFAVIAMLTGVNVWFSEGGRLSLDEVKTQYWTMVRKAVQREGPGGVDPAVKRDVTGQG